MVDWEQMHGEVVRKNMTLQAEILSLRQQLETARAEGREAGLEEAARAGYVACAETRHVRLGDGVSTAIRALKSEGPR